MSRSCKQAVADPEILKGTEAVEAVSEWGGTKRFSKNAKNCVKSDE